MDFTSEINKQMKEWQKNKKKHMKKGGASTDSNIKSGNKKIVFSRSYIILQNQHSRSLRKLQKRIQYRILTDILASRMQRSPQGSAKVSGQNQAFIEML